jgi:cell envelope opacity-associated protein A
MESLMRILIAAAAGAAALAACQPDSEKTNPAVATEESDAQREAAAPAAGASSFTEEQARGRITEAGYTDVTGLMKAEDGTWQGTAMQNGQSVTVVVDYQGNVTTR